MEPGSAFMRNDLNTQSLIPPTEPYTSMGYDVENGGTTVSASVMQATGDMSVVDWVLVQLHEDNSVYTVDGRRAALVLRNGMVVDPQGHEQIRFNATMAGRHVSVLHRNHLGVLCTSLLAGNDELVDFTLPTTPTFGNNAQRMIEGRMALWPGDVSDEGEVKYTGTGNDRDGILVRIGGNEPTNIVPGYYAADTNMNGFVSYTGAKNDRDVVLVTIGGAVGTMVRAAQMP